MGALKDAVIFLLSDYLERKRLKYQSYLATADRFRHEAYIPATITEGARELSKSISEAEALLAELQA